MCAIIFRKRRLTLARAKVYQLARAALDYSSSDLVCDILCILVSCRSASRDAGIDRRQNRRRLEGNSMDNGIPGRTVFLTEPPARLAGNCFGGCWAPDARAATASFGTPYRRSARSAAGAAGQWGSRPQFADRLRAVVGDIALPGMGSPPPTATRCAPNADHLPLRGHHLLPERRENAGRRTCAACAISWSFARSVRTALASSYFEVGGGWRQARRLHPLKRISDARREPISSNMGRARPPRKRSWPRRAPVSTSSSCGQASSFPRRVPQEILRECIGPLQI